MSSTAAVMARRLEWAQRMVREDDPGARGSLERELFATVVESDEQVMTMFSEWNRRSIPPHPLAELDAVITARRARRSDGSPRASTTHSGGSPLAAHTGGVRSIDEELLKALELIRCTSSSRSRSNEEEELLLSEELGRSSPPHSPSDLSLGAAVTDRHVKLDAKSIAKQNATTTGRGAWKLPSAAVRRMPSPDATSTNWMTNQTEATSATRPIDQQLHPVDFGGVLEILTLHNNELQQKDGQDVPSTESCSPGRTLAASRREEELGIGCAPPNGGVKFPSQHLLRFPPSNIRHYPLKSDFSMERVDYFTRPTDATSDDAPSPKQPKSAAGRNSSPPSTPYVVVETAVCVNSGTVLEGGRTEPDWLEATAFPRGARASEGHHQKDDEMTVDPAEDVERHGSNCHHDRVQTPSVDVSVAGLQSIIERVSSQLRQRELQRHQHSHSRTSSSSPARRVQR